jgi:predicted DNA-binding protein (UPF0251 family)
MYGIVPSMTPKRFSALARLIRMRRGAAEEAARLVLVDGMRPIEAARRIGLSPQSVSNAVARVRRAERALTF